MAAIGVYQVMMRKNFIDIYGEAYPDAVNSFLSGDGLLFVGAFIAVVASAVFVCFFVGGENHVLKNRIACGHSRASIYLSNLIVTAAGGIVINAVYTVTVIIVKNIFLIKGEMPAGKILMLFLFASLFIISLTAFYLLFAMLIPNRIASVVVTLLIAFILLAWAGDLKAKISQPQYIGIDGQYENPSYIDGRMRDVMNFVYEITPSCQLYEIYEQNEDRLVRMAVASGAELFMFAAAGILIFRKKDIK